jgi:hypothetical protein
MFTPVCYIEKYPGASIAPRYLAANTWFLPD